MGEGQHLGGISRRDFLAAAVATGLAAYIPLDLAARALAAPGLDDAAATGLPKAYFFTEGDEYATCAAICSRIVPSGTDPTTDPGAAEAKAVVFIDRFLAAFALPTSVADNPAIYIRGRFSGRHAFPDYTTGLPSKDFPPNAFLSPDGQAHFIDLSPLQELSWHAQLAGTPTAVARAPLPVDAKWAAQVTNGTIPAPPAGGLQEIYRQGLAAFDSYSQGLFQVPFAQATATEQDLMLETAGNVVLGQLPAAPAAARALFPVVTIHTFEGTYGLPEYRWQQGAQATAIWQAIGWDGDTQPLGNSVYDENLYGPGEGPNQGFGQEGVFLPQGDYREFRPVSYLGTTEDVVSELTQAELAPIIAGLQKLGLLPPSSKSS